jgi:mannose-6-phosphate isomerase-like protein (cupin superfamily)
MEPVIDASMLPVLPIGPLGSVARIMHGLLHGFPGMSLMLATLQPGEGPVMHRHPYDEAFVIGEGRARFMIDGEAREASGGQVVLVPAGAQHAFANVGEGVLRMTAIHVGPRVEIEWLEAPWDGAD